VAHCTGVLLVVAAALASAVIEDCDDGGTPRLKRKTAKSRADVECDTHTYEGDQTDLCKNFTDANINYWTTSFSTVSLYRASQIVER